MLALNGSAATWDNAAGVFLHTHSHHIALYLSSLPLQITTNSITFSLILPPIITMNNLPALPQLQSTTPQPHLPQKLSTLEVQGYHPLNAPSTLPGALRHWPPPPPPRVDLTIVLPPLHHQFSGYESIAGSLGEFMLPRHPPPPTPITTTPPALPPHPHHQYVGFEGNTTIEREFEDQRHPTQHVRHFSNPTLSNLNRTEARRVPLPSPPPPPPRHSRSPPTPPGPLLTWAPLV